MTHAATPAPHFILRRAAFAIALVILTASPRIHAADAEPETAAPDAPASSLTELELQFRDQMTSATLEGLWQMTRDGELSEPRAEKYTISKVEKLAGTKWLFYCRIQYGERDATVPLPIDVIWAGDTPVITLYKSAIPMIGTYSARVVLHEGFYAGVWQGDGYGGVLSGRIVRGTRNDE